MPAATVTISSQSRRALKSFEFQADENQSKSYKGQQDDVGKKCTDNDVSEELVQSDEQSDQELETRVFPNTPAHRIAFTDLIANPEDALSKVVAATPNAQVEWRHVPGSSELRKSGRAHQRGQKRAYSSSPATSSQKQRVKIFRSDKEPLDLDSITRSLHTPKQDDPVLALWDRYADTHDENARRGPTLSPLPPLSSSPNTPNTSRRDEILRRTASCGLEWPTSATKRRKTGLKDHYSRAKGIFAANKNVILAKNQPKTSRVSMLVESIQQTLEDRAILEAEGPSSSSPIPERHDNLQVSPMCQARPTVVSAHQAEPERLNHNDEQDDNSSDFGDMDIDVNDPDLLKALQSAGPQAAPASTLKQRTTHLSPPSCTHDKLVKRASRVKDAVDCEQILPTLVVNDAHPVYRNEPEEFGDDDDDLLATEMEALVKQVDSQGASRHDAVEHGKPVMHGTSLHPLRDKSSAADLNDDFDDEDDNDIWDAIDDKTAFTSVQSDGSSDQQYDGHKAIKRYVIVEVTESTYKTPQGRQSSQKVLSIKDEKSRENFTIFLRQSWFDTRCSRGSFVHLIGGFDSQNKCIVDDTANMVILHPDHLISATVVADSFSCVRRAALQDRVKATNPAEAPQVYGHLIHEVFGEALKQNIWTLENLRTIVKTLLPNYIESLYEIGVQCPDAIEYVMSKMPDLIGWANTFISAATGPNAQIRDRNGALVPTSIQKLLELEEHIWSPMYGLKGNVDATVQVKMRLPSDEVSRTLTVPLELKTGKRDTNEMHRAQTALYTLLLSDRYDINVTSGILYYLETSKTFRVEGIRNELRHMIIQRNELACYVHDKLALPPMIKREHLCRKCYAQTSCFTYHKLAENGDVESSGMKDIFRDAVSHLGSAQQDFFRKWDDLLTKEERDSMKFRRELWTMHSIEREAVGRCFSKVIIEPGSAFESTNSPKINRFTYSFVKYKGKTGFSFTESQITVGEPIVISDENGHFALANGYVTNVRPSRITVAVDRRLQNARRKQPGFHPETNQVFASIMDVNGEALDSPEFVEDTPFFYRIDKDEFANGMATARNNVLRIMEKDLFRARELRQLIVENKPPVFKHASTAYTLSGPASQQQLNADQRRAIEKVMSARDYALVLGMPGTGKTTTIAHIIRALVSQGKSVLLTSYTHTAVDNILLKIKDDNIPILRLGATGKVHPEVQQFADLAGVPKKTIAELERSWSHSKVVATTCLGINHAIFNHRKFDYCIVDEASQITLPVCLGPIRLASTFILVGDHYQLPPLVQNKEALEGGLDVSLFKLLSERQPSSVVNLEHQYRMAKDVMIFSNELVYSDRLKCGNSAVASRILSIPNLNAGLEAHHYDLSSADNLQCTEKHCIWTPTKKCWLGTALLPENRSIFLNTDTLSLQPGNLGAPEIISGSGTRITNTFEAVLTSQLLTTLVRSGVPPKSIGVITFYRSQLALLRTTVKAMAGTSAAAEVEMHTADKYQGRDKEVIILSFVRSNASSHVGELLKDWRRVNVALTRAKSKLIILGSALTLRKSGIPVIEGMMKILYRERWMLDLPVHAVESHKFETVWSQTQSHRHASPHKSMAAKMNGRLGGQSSQIVQKYTRQPLNSANVNIAGRQDSRKMKTPTKTVHGAVDIDKVLKKNPIMRNVVDEVFEN